jgi:REP element-mobilizing transposase RayT
MARKYRVEVPGGTFHIATRAVYQQHAFKENGDRSDFMNILSEVVELYGWRCKSYCLMGSHYHLVVQTPAPNLSSGMRLLNGKYAQRFNRRHRRRGHLFGERFLSVLVKSDSHLLSALRYVARNPVAAGLCETPSDWQWSSYRALVGLDPALRLLDLEGVLDLFGPGGPAARAQFARFVEGSAWPNASDEYDLAAMDGV